MKCHFLATYAVVIIYYHVVQVFPIVVIPWKQVHSGQINNLRDFFPYVFINVSKENQNRE